MLNFEEVIVVEGKYDKAKLSKIVSSLVLCCNGFDVYKNENTRSLIRKFAQNQGIIVLTDSDYAGKRLRNYIKSFCGENARIKNAYIPDVFGKEKRKSVPGKEGKLGVEGFSIDDLKEILANFKCDVSKGLLNVQDFFELGLSGNKNSSDLRKKICAEFDLPANLSTKQMVEILNALNIDKVRLSDSINVGEFYDC